MLYVEFWGDKYINLEPGCNERNTDCERNGVVLKQTDKSIISHRENQFKISNNF